MAEAFLAFVSYVGAAVGGVSGAITAVTFVIEYGAVLYFAAALAASSAYSGSQRRRAERQARDGYNASLEDRLVMTPLAGGQRSRVYGKVRNVEGVLFKATRGADSEVYTLVISLAGHQIEAIDTVYFDDIAVEIDADGYVLTEPFAITTRVSADASGTAVEGLNTVTLPHTPIAGSVLVLITASADVGTDAAGTVSGNTVSFTATAPYVGEYGIRYQYLKRDGKARVRKYLGGAAQDLSGVLLPLFPDLLTANDRFAGDACLIVDLQYAPDAFPTGVPNISAVIRGANDVLDLRTGLRGYTENPALIANDWAFYKFGGNFPAGTVREVDVIAAANACDVITTFTKMAASAATVNIVRPLYTCGIVCRTDQDPSQSFDEIVESMAGRSGWSGGVLRMRAGVYRAPVATLTEDWLSGAEAITIVPEGPADEAVNIVRATIADEAQSYTVAAAPDVRADAYITIDGRELPQDLTYGGVTDDVHAQHVSGIILREARSALTATLPCNLRAFQLEQFDVIRVTLPHYGWDAKLFEVAEWKFSVAGGVLLTLRETGPSIFDPAALFSATDATPNTQLPNPFNVPEVTGLTLGSGTAWLLRQDDGTVSSRLNVRWNPITDAGVVNGGAIEVRYGQAPTAASSWATIEVPGGDSQVTIPAVQDGGLYIVTARARNALVHGQWAVHKWHTIVGKTERPADVQDFTAVPGARGVPVRWRSNEVEADYAATQVRAGASWASGVAIFSGKADGFSWLPAIDGVYTLWAKHFDSSANQSLNAVSVEVLVTAAEVTQWADLIGRPMLFRVSARGYSDQSAQIGSGLYRGETSELLVGSARSYTMARVRRSDGVVVFSRKYDVYAAGTDPSNPAGYPRGAADLAADLNSSGSDVIVVLFTADEPYTNRLTAGLPAAIYRCGGSRAVFGSPAFQGRSAYVLIGIGGCGEGNGYESYNGSVLNDTNAFCDVSFTLQSGNLLITGGGATPRSLADYSYTGDLNATFGADWSTNVANIPYASVYNNDDSVALGFSMEDWPAGQTFPTGWVNWDGPPPSKETATVRAGGSALRYSGVAAGNVGTLHTSDFRSTPLPTGTFLAGSFDVFLAARSAGMPLVLVRLFTTSSVDDSGYRDVQVFPSSATTGGWQRVPWSARVLPSERIYAISIFVMASWVGGAQGQFTGGVIFDNLMFALFDNSTDNRTIVLNADGTASGGVGGQVTLTGLGAGGLALLDQVGTEQLAPGAITQVTPAGVATGLSVTGDSGTFTSYSNTVAFTLVANHSFVAEATGTAYINIAANCYFSGNSGVTSGPGSDRFGCQFQAYIDFNGDGSVNSGDQVVAESTFAPASEGTVYPITKQIYARPQIQLTEGVSYSWNVYANKLYGNLTLNRFEISVELIKR